MSEENAAPEPVASPEPVGEPAPVETPEPTGPSVEDVRAEYEAKLAKALNDRTMFERSKVELEQKLKGYDSSKAEQEAREKEFRENPIKALEAYGFTFDQAAQFLIDGKAEAKTPEQLALEKLQNDSESTKKELAEKLERLEKEREEEKASALFRSNLEHVRGVVAGEDFTVLREMAGDAGLENATRILQEEHQKNGNVDVEARLKQMEEQTIADVVGLINKPAVISKLLENESLLAIVKEALSPKDETPEQSSEEEPAQPAAQGKGKGRKPRTITEGLASQTGSKGNRRNKYDEDANRQNALRALRNKIAKTG